MEGCWQAIPTPSPPILSFWMASERRLGLLIDWSKSLRG
ncbi:hypothetical protein AVEN_157615-1, partial [Araneus ventricosus]